MAQLVARGQGRGDGANRDGAPAGRAAADNRPWIAAGAPQHIYEMLDGTTVPANIMHYDGVAEKWKCTMCKPWNPPQCDNSCAQWHFHTNKHKDALRWEMSKLGLSPHVIAFNRQHHTFNYEPAVGTVRCAVQCLPDRGGRAGS